MKTIVLCNEESCLEFPLEHKYVHKDLTFLDNDNQVIMILNKEQEILEPYVRYQVCNFGEVMLFEDVPSKYYKCESKTLLIGNQQAHIKVPDYQLVFDNFTLRNVNGMPIYINGKKSDKRVQKIEEGDRIFISSFFIIPHPSYIEVIGNHEGYECTLSQIEDVHAYDEHFPNYKRSPRVRKRTKTEEVSIHKPPTKEPMKKGSLVKMIVPPLTMMGVTLLTSILIPRGIYVIISVIGTLMSTIFSLTSYFSERKELQKKNEKRTRIYESYLLDMRKKLSSFQKKEVAAHRYHNPTMKELESMVSSFSSRIYEKDVHDDDFLFLNIGSRRELADYKIKLDYEALQMEKDDLLEEAKLIVEDYQYIEHKPVQIDLKKAHLGIVGEKVEVHEQLKWFLAQLTFFQSYHDLEIIMLYNQDDQKEFDFIRWFPHFKIRQLNITGNIYNEQIRDQVMGSMYQILKDRKLKRDESKKETGFLPHFIFIIDDFQLIMNHSIMEYLQEASTDLGFTLIHTAQKKASLPENVKTVFVMEDRDTGRLLLNEGNTVNKQVKVNRILDADMERMARDLSILNHQQGMVSQIPGSMTFFDMYHVQKPEELDIQQRWASHDSHKSLAVPLGVRAVDDIVELNLHEKAHGPHGLVAGTTGSGKSEIVKSYILSLAVNFHPYEVGFLLIDYKGGGMASLFKNLPHLLGTITNLDGAESMRALASIKSELARRQRIFNTFDVNHINQYNKLFKAKEAQEPLPHLFIISDEFAELKKEQPDFMRELVSAARIGRSLGVHLILATQKPSGVVDDQIWSNSKFKLALKVQNEADSKEVIKTGDAAFITQPGRAYLQVGNNEIYELFQSAWSGATYVDGEEGELLDDRIYKLNNIGQGMIINQDLSEKQGGKAVAETQLDVTVAHIAKVYQTLGAKEVSKPWLPSLKDKIVSPYIEIEKISHLEQIQNLDLKCPLGLIDIPEEQKQEDYVIDFIKDGNFCTFASSGFGKSFTLSTIMSTLAVKNNPALLNFYILDFGNSSLIPFRNLPHTADYMTFDSNEKLNKFMNIIEKEIKERKQLFGREMVQNYDIYNQTHPDQKLKAIFIVIDNFDVIKELPYEMDMENFIMRMTRDGFGLGIYTIITATRLNAIRYAILNNFKNKIAQYLFDESDITGIVGRSAYRLSESKGRALIKKGQVSVMQIYSPVSFETDVEYIQKLKHCIDVVKAQYHGEHVKGIPVLPDVFTTHDFSQFAFEQPNTNSVGLSIEEVEIVGVDTTNTPYVIIGPIHSGKTNLLEILLSQAQGIKYVFDSDQMSLYHYRGKEHIHYVDTEEQLNNFITSLAEEINKRRSALTERYNLEVLRIQNPS